MCRRGENHPRRALNPQPPRRASEIRRAATSFNAAALNFSLSAFRTGAKRVRCTQRLHLFHAFDKRLELAAARRMTQLAQRLGFDLPNALAGNLEALAHFFK